MSATTIDHETKNWIRSPADEIAAKAGCRFDEERAQFTVDWIERYCKLYEGVQWSGKPMKLLPWALDATLRLFGWVVWDEHWNQEVRRFKQASIWISKKAGKSPQLSAWGLYLLCGDGEQGQHVFFGAKDGNAARKIVGEHLKQMLLQSPELMDECKMNETTGRISHLPSKSFLEPLSSSNSRTQESKEGLNGSLLIDECFVAGTLISTTSGAIPIDRVVPGDKVFHALGAGVVLGTHRRQVAELYHLEYSDGTSLRCTARHPVFTGRGWVEAGQLVVGALAYRQEDVQALRDGIPAASVEEQGWPDLRSDREVVDQAGVLLDILRQEGSQPDVCGVGAEEAIDNSQAHGTPAAGQGRQRQAASRATRRATASVGAGMGTRTADSYQDATRRRLPNLLQGGRRQRSDEGRYRGGRRVAQFAQAEGEGCEENGASDQPRLVSVSRVECERPVTVFNLHVSGHPSYFANGRLVHNCHVVDWDFMRRLTRMGMSRIEPLQLEVSTAGNNPDSYGRDRFSYAQEVQSGARLDQELFVVIHAAPQDLSDEQLAEDPLKYGKMANPSLGITVSPKEFLSDYEKSKRSIQDFLDFKMYRLNIWQKGSNPWLRSGDWDACKEDFTEEDLHGQQCWTALDLSRTKDMCALVLTFKDDHRDEHFFQLPYFWLPEKRAAELSKEGVRLEWAKGGFLELTPGDVIDYGYIKARYRALAKLFDIQELAFDPKFAEEITQSLCEGEYDDKGNCIVPGLGIERFAFAQTDDNFAAPTADYERLVLAHKLHHKGHPVLSWQAGHVQCIVKVSKVKRAVKPNASSHRTVDGVVAGIMALGRAMQAADTGWFSPKMMRN